MSDYTLTPKLGLYKPTPNADSDQWGGHWNWNADTLDNVLPLSGGTVTGSITVPTIVGSPDIDVSPAYNGRYHTSVARNWPTPTGEIARWDYNIGGAVAGGQQVFAEYHGVNSDALDATNAQGGGLTYFGMGGGPSAGAIGGRTAFGMQFSQTGATVCAPGQYYAGGAFFAQSAYSAGGAAGATRGALFASNDSVALNTGAGLYWESITGYELNVSAETGVGVNYKQGINVVTWVTDAVAGAAGRDFAYGITAQGTAPAGWDVGYSFGHPYGYWPMKPAGTLIGTLPSHTGGPAYAAAWGIDFSAVAFSSGLIRGPGFSVNSQGGIDLGSSYSAGSRDVSRHVNLYGGTYGFGVSSDGAFDLVAPASGYYVWAGTTRVAWITGTGIEAANIGGQIPGAGTFTQVMVGSTTGPTWTTGTLVPGTTQPVGSLYSRVGGAVGATLYVSRGAGSWSAVAGV